MADDPVDAIARVRCRVIVDELTDDFARFRVEQNGLQRIVRGHESVRVLHQPIDRDRRTVI